MQEEVESRIVSIAIDCVRLTEQELRKAISAVLAQMKESTAKLKEKHSVPKGQMTVKQLAGKDKGMQSIEVTEKTIGSFNRVARKYGIDFAPFKVKGESRYMVFFKSADADAMTAAFKDYTSRQLKKAERPSMLQKLEQYKDLIKAPTIPKVRSKELGR